MREGCKYISDNKEIHKHFVKHVRELTQNMFSDHEIGNIIIDGKEKVYVIAGVAYPIGQTPMGVKGQWTPNVGASKGRLDSKVVALVLGLNRALYSEKLDDVNWIVASRQPMNIFSEMAVTKRQMEDRVKFVVNSNHIGVSVGIYGEIQIISGVEFTSGNVLNINMNVLSTINQKNPSMNQMSPTGVSLGRQIRMLGTGTTHIVGNESLNHSDGVLYALFVTGWGIGTNLSYPESDLRSKIANKVMGNY